MQNASKFRDKIENNQPCLGIAVSFTDPTVTESVADVLDFVWLDMEHGPLSVEDVQLHCMATKGSDCTALVRVPWNDPVVIKRVLDVGVDGVIVPMVSTAEEARLAVSACKYPPEGIRGYGPRRASGYGKIRGSEFCKLANEEIIIIAQIEQIEAIRNLDEILNVPGLTSIFIGPYDLSGSMGYPAQPNHPEVLAVIEPAVKKARDAGIMVGMAVMRDAEKIRGWMDKGVQWFYAQNDFSILRDGAAGLSEEVRKRLSPP